MMNMYDYAVFFFTNNESKQKILRAFEASFGGGLLTKLRLIFESKDTMEFTQMNSPLIIMRKLSDAIMSSISCIQFYHHRLIYTGWVWIWHSSKSLVLRDLSNSDGSDIVTKEDDGKFDLQNLV